MKHVSKKFGERGFSLVELMIVVGIIGVLATLALPRFKQFQAKAKMGEAKNLLSHVYTLEQSFALDNNAFLAFGNVGPGACQPNAAAQQLGFRIDPCNNTVPRFSYSAAQITNINVDFLATAATGAGPANRVCPGNPSFNITVNQANVFSGTGAAAGGGEVNVGGVCAL